MKEMPILFSTEMVQALLEDRKTNTRRTKGLEKVNQNPNDWEFFRLWNGYAKFCEVGNSINELYIKCPYGQVGDVLWVREAFCLKDSIKNLHDASFKPDTKKYIYKADYSKVWIDTAKKYVKWKPSIHMPKEACRLKLKITNIRVERLQEISEQDARVEGVYEFEKDEAYKDYMHNVGSFVTARGSFSSLWQSINGLESWDENPWVWVVEFERVNL